MTDRDRIKQRIENDKRKKEQRRVDNIAKYDNYNNMLNYRYHNSATRDCMRNVSWKGSVQKYELKTLTNNHHKITELESKSPVVLNTGKNIIIRERGKERKITSVNIEDRVFQKVLSQNIVVPIITQHLMYDNGASLNNKGVTFARNRIRKHFVSAMKEYNNDFYILKFDFKKFFESIQHKTVRRVLNKYFSDKDVVNLILNIVKEYKKIEIKGIQDKEERERQLELLEKEELSGICLGSEVSQNLALIVPNEMDLHIKDKSRIKYYVRYMDDGLIMGDKETLESVYAEISEIVKSLGLKFNTNKTYIVHCTKGVKFLQRKYIVSKKGKLIIKLTSKNIRRERKKLRKLFKLIKKGERTLDAAYDSMQAWLSLTKGINAYHARKNMIEFYDELFDGYRITKKYFENKKLYERGIRDDKILQNFGWDELYRDRKHDKFLQVPA